MVSLSSRSRCQIHISTPWSLFWCRGAPYFQMVENKLQYDIKPYCQLGSPAYASEFIIAIKNFFWQEKQQNGPRTINPLMQARITTQSPTNDGVQAIKQLMQDRFPQHFCEAHTFDINAKFGDLHQRLEETLLTHYKRASKLYDETCRCLRPENGDFSLTSWDRFSRWYHQVICKEYNQLFIWKRGCQEIELTSKIILLGAFYWRGSRTNKGSKITKLADEEPRKKQLHYYKSLAEKNILSSCPRQSQASIGYSFSHLTTETQPKGQPVIAPRPNKPGNNK